MSDTIKPEIREIILETAAKLFSTHGFKAVDLPAIAKSAEVPLATLKATFSDEKALYTEVFQWGYEKELVVIESVIETIDSDEIENTAYLKEKLFALVNGLVDMYLVSPELAILGIRRWLDDAGNELEVNHNFTLPIYQEILKVAERSSQARDLKVDLPDVRFVFTGFTWMLYGMLTSGVIDWDETRLLPEDAQTQNAIKEFLYFYACAMLNL